MKALNSIKLFLSALIILVFSMMSFDGIPAHAQDSASNENSYDSGTLVPFRGVAIIGQNFTAIPVGEASVTFCCDGCGSDPDASGSGGVSCTGCTGGGGPVSCPSGTITVTCQDSLEGCPAE